MSDLVPVTFFAEFTCWNVTLRSGRQIHLRAHAYAEDETFVRFYGFIEGRPLVEQELMCIPAAEVEDVEGGWIDRPPTWT